MPGLPGCPAFHVVNQIVGSPVDVSVRIQSDTFPNTPSGDVIAGRHHAATEFMPQHEAASVDLRKIGGMKVTAADVHHGIGPDD
jgi:hypothetical protein